MVTRRPKRAVAMTIFGALLASVTFAADPSFRGSSTTSPRAEDCDGEETAVEYDRKAEEYEAAAERYRAFASAEGIFNSEIYGKEWEFQQQSQRFDRAAEESRAAAAALRSAVTSKNGSPEGCSVDSIAANG